MAQTPRRFTEDQQHQICQWYAEFMTPEQIRRRVKEEWGIVVGPRTIWEYAHATKKWQPMIERLRQQWVLGVMDIPLAHKRARLEKLVTLLRRAEALQADPEAVP